MPENQSPFKRLPLDKSKRQTVCACLRETLPVLTDLGLAAKQIHWNIVGAHFLSVHVKLDEVVEIARDSADVVAERMVQLGESPDGRAPTVAANGKLSADLPDSFMSVDDGLKAIGDRLKSTSDQLRHAINGVGDDPLTEDLLISMAQDVEKQLWMFQALEAK